MNFALKYIWVWGSKNYGVSIIDHKLIELKCREWSNFSVLYSNSYTKLHETVQLPNGELRSMLRVRQAGKQSNCTTSLTKTEMKLWQIEKFYADSVVVSSNLTQWVNPTTILALYRGCWIGLGLTFTFTIFGAFWQYLGISAATRGFCHFKAPIVTRSFFDSSSTSTKTHAVRHEWTR